MELDCVTAHEGGEEDFEVPCILHRDIKNVQRILAEREGANGMGELFVKYKGMSYRWCEWVPKDAVLQTDNGRSLYEREKPGSEPSFDAAYLKIEKILDTKTVDNQKLFLVKWQNLDYDELSWEPAESLNSEEALRTFKRWTRMPSLSERFEPKTDGERKWEWIKDFPSSKNGKKLVPYQVKGVNLIIRGMCSGQNMLVADEIGRTEQVCAFLRFLNVCERIQGLFLIVTKLESIESWERELKEWTDSKILSYYGIEERRKAMRKYEFYHPGALPRFNVLITTCEWLVREPDLFQAFTWQVLIVDMIGSLSVLEMCSQLKPKFAILLQNSLGKPTLQELELVIKFLDRQGTFAGREKDYARLSDSDKLVELVSFMRPYTLMRSQDELLHAYKIPNEMIIECDMTEHQIGYYQAIFQRHKNWMTNPIAVWNRNNMKNVFQTIRRICNHPYLVRGAESEILQARRIESSSDSKIICDTMINASGKLMFLDALLMQTREKRRRVAVFSATSEMLDILADYLRFRHYFYEKFDGTLRGDDLAEAIERFNARNSPDFVCLVQISDMRIVFERVDVIVIYDGTWNMWSDIHFIMNCVPFREGVSVYRLITEGSIEATLFDRDYARSLLTKMDYALSQPHKLEEIDSVLKIGVLTASDLRPPDKEGFDSKIARSWHVFYGDIEPTVQKHEPLVSDNDEGPINFDSPELWDNFVPVIDEERYEKEVSIAQRCVMRRQGRAVRRGERDENTIWREVRFIDDCVTPVNSILLWTPDDQTKAFRVFCRFGWGRWNAIKQASSCQVPTREIRAFSYAVLEFLLDKATKQHPIIELIFKSAIAVDINDLKRQFLVIGRDVILSCIGDNADRYLDVLSDMALLNGLVGTCPSPPEDIVMPDLPPLCENWDRSDDQQLLFAAFSDGFGEYYHIHSDEGLSQELLNQRVVKILNKLKKFFITFKSARGKTLSFDHATLKKAVSVWSSEEQKNLIYYLVNYGYTTPEDFARVLGTRRSPEDVDSFVNIVFFVCNGVTEYINDLAEGLTPSVVKQISERVPFFRIARGLCENKKLAYDDSLVVQTISESGFLEIYETVYLVSRFGREKLETKLIDFVLDLAGVSRSKLRLSADRSRVIQEKETPKERTPRVHPTPEFETDEDGNVILPLCLSGSLHLISLGRVVFDRPGFHSARYIYTDGFCTERLYPSTLNPTERVWYRSLIIDRGGYEPVFRVEMKDNPSVFYETSTPSATWLHVVRDVNTAKKNLGLSHSERVTISGPECYGLAIPFVMLQIQKLPDAEKCRGYVFRSPDQPFDIPGRRKRTTSKELPVEIIENEEE